MLRRDAIKTLLSTTTAVGLGSSSRSLLSQDQSTLPPVRAITKGPKFHWRGYYDKLLFDASDRCVLANQVDFEHRSPEPDDEIRVGMIDLADNDRWVDLGGSTAWNWQQGCMLQWLPGDKRQILWNDRQGDHFIAHILDVDSGKQRQLPMPIYCVSPDAKWGLSVDFRRLNECRPGYGYSGVDDPHRNEPAPDETGIWRVDLESGESRLLISYAQVAATKYDPDIKLQYNPQQSKHWINHLLISPDGKRFLFLHRWRETSPTATREEIARTSFSTRMWTCNADGSDPYIVDPYGKTSHFVWRDSKTICAWAWHPSYKDRFYLFHDKSTQTEAVGPEVMTQNGHNTYLPKTDNDWILNDTYPDKGRIQHPYLYQISTNKRVDLGHFLSPEKYQREWRCDNHPSASNSGRYVTIDSPHEGHGRQVYLIDISEILSRHA